MSLDQACMAAYDVNAYHPERAQRLALRYASGDAETGLSELHRADPAAYPSPVIVRRWRSVWPAFDALMREAEAARGVALMEATIGIADNPRVQAARAKNSIAVRWRMAEALDPGTFGQRRILAGDVNAPLRLGAAVDLTDAELGAIARGVDPALLLTGPNPDDASRAPPHTPPLRIGGGSTRGDEGGHVSTAESDPEISTPGIGAAPVSRAENSPELRDHSASGAAQSDADMRSRFDAILARAGASARDVDSGQEASSAGGVPGMYARVPDSVLRALAGPGVRDPLDEVYGVDSETMTRGEGYELD